MNVKEILAICDHTLLAQGATEAEIKAICDDGIRFNTASVCIPPSHVKMAKEYVGDKLAICTVIGFPNGYMTTATKVFETADAVKNGADEIDMVINVGLVKDGRYADVLDEIKQIRKACEGKILKVIIETCLLTEEEKIEMTKVVSASGADFIKTSTGFAGGGATVADIELFAAHRAPHLKIKAAGGISSLTDAEAMMKAGAERLGTSRIVKIAKQESAPEGTY
jgi:deoxyribose-phosphate aldolase